MSEPGVTSEISRNFPPMDVSAIAIMGESTEFLGIMLWPSFLQSLGMRRLVDLCPYLPTPRTIRTFWRARIFVFVFKKRWWESYGTLS